MKPTNPHRATPSAALAAGLLLALSAGAAIADSTNPAVFHERAPVIRSIPVYASVAHPVRECTQEYERQADPSPASSGAGVDEHRPGRTILGAVIGGLAGSTIGKGNGRVAAAAVGAATGAVIGNNWGGGSNASSGGGAEPQEAREVLVERCLMIERWRQEVVGYDVTYRYHGREFVARMDREPGAEVGVRVTVEVDDGARGR